MNIFMFYIIRLCVLVIAIWFGYLFVNSFIKPTILYEKCLTDTDSCTELELYQYENNFIVKEKVSQLYFWYNGQNLYIYGQNQDQSCMDRYSPVNVFTMNVVENTINFIPFPNQCIDDIDTIINYYQDTFNIQPKIYYTRKNNDSLQNNIFSIIQQMYNENIFTI